MADAASRLDSRGDTAAERRLAESAIVHVDSADGDGPANLGSGDLLVGATIPCAPSSGRRSRSSGWPPGKRLINVVVDGY